jgi:hypothetical protein
MQRMLQHSPDEPAVSPAEHEAIYAALGSLLAVSAAAAARKEVQRPGLMDVLRQVLGPSWREMLTAEERKQLRLVSSEVRGLFDPLAEGLRFNVEGAMEELEELCGLLAKLTRLRSLHVQADSDMGAISERLGECGCCSCVRLGPWCCSRWRGSALFEAAGMAAPCSSVRGCGWWSLVQPRCYGRRCMAVAQGTRALVTVHMWMRLDEAPGCCCCLLMHPFPSMRHASPSPGPVCLALQKP